MKSHLLCFVSLIVSATLLSANTNLRNWVMADDSKIYAELISYDDVEDTVHIRVDELESRYYRIGDFSVIDQAWLVEWLEVSEALEQKLQEVPGQFTSYNYQGEFSIYDFYVYEPASVLRDSDRPMMILISAGPNGRRYLLRHIDAAEATGIVIVAMDRFENTQSPEHTEQQRQHFSEILPIIERTVSHDPQKLFMGGTSGGALRAHLFSCYFDRPWKGIYSNGGWLGRSSHLQERYPPASVAMVNGNIDHAANAYVERDSQILRENGASVALFSFEGGHQIPPTDSLIKAFDWLLNPDEFEKAN